MAHPANWIKKVFGQSAAILAVSFLIALTVNAVRPNGLPVVMAVKSIVDVSEFAKEIPLKDAVVLYATNRATFVDARSRAEYDCCHITGALCLPVGEFDDSFQSVEKQLSDSDVIITYCDGERCPLSHEVAQMLEHEGFENVFVLHNGWTLWRNEGLPITKSKDQ